MSALLGGEHRVCPREAHCELLCLPGLGLHAAPSCGAALGAMVMPPQGAASAPPEAMLPSWCAALRALQPSRAQGSWGPCPAPASLLSHVPGSPSAARQWNLQGDSQGLPPRSAGRCYASGQGVLRSPAVLQLSPSCKCGQAAPALAIAMTLAKISSVQCAAGTSVPSSQHLGDCAFPPQGTVNIGRAQVISMQRWQESMWRSG